MGTRSNFGILNSDGTVKAAYVHWDGYPTGVGAELLKDFNTPESINERLALGNASTLVDGFYKDLRCPRPNLGRGHRKLNDDQNAVTFQSKDEYLTEHVYGWVEYQYLYEGGMWNAYKVPNGGYHHWEFPNGGESKSVLMGPLRKVVESERKAEARG